MQWRNPPTSILCSPFPPEECSHLCISQPTLLLLFYPLAMEENPGRTQHCLNRFETSRSQVFDESVSTAVGDEEEAAAAATASSHFPLTSILEAAAV